MGYTSYNYTSRSARAESAGYFSEPIDKVFIQQKEQKVHESMKSQGIALRESRDSKEHPNTVPIIVALDVTGSMGHIPHLMIKEGLPTLVSTIIQRGIKDPAILFLAIGDHECDRYPLQVGQFESGDEELDMWLTRTFLEGRGGGNAGESYGLAYYFAANHTQLDATKRGQKGLLFTIGDEPFLKKYPTSALKEIMGKTVVSEKDSYSMEELLSQAMKTYDVYHISVEHGYRDTDPAWRELLGEHLIVIKDHEKIPEIIAETVINSTFSTEAKTPVLESIEEDKEKFTML